MPAVCWDESERERERERPGREHLDAALAIQRFSLCPLLFSVAVFFSGSIQCAGPIIRAPSCKQQLIQIHQHCVELESLVYVETSGSFL